MLELTSSATTISSEMFSDSKLVIFCGRLLSKTVKSSGFRPLTNRPSPSVTTAVNCTTSTSTASLTLEALGVDGRGGSSTLDVLGRDADRMLDDLVHRRPSRTEMAQRLSVQTLRPSAKNTTSLTCLDRRRRLDHGDQAEQPAHVTRRRPAR